MITLAALSTLTTLTIAAPDVDSQAWLRQQAPVRAACKRGNAAACDELGRRARPLLDAPRSMKAAVRASREACRHGSPESCSWMLEVSMRPELAPPTRRLVSRHACRAGVDEACLVAERASGANKMRLGRVLIPVGIAAAVTGGVGLHLLVLAEPHGPGDAAVRVVGFVEGAVFYVAGHAITAAGQKLYLDGRRLSAGPGSRTAADVLGYLNIALSAVGAIAPVVYAVTVRDPRLEHVAGMLYGSTALQATMAVVAATVPVGSGRSLDIQATPVALPTRDGVAPGAAFRMSF